MIASEKEIIISDEVTEENARETIKKHIDENELLLFMKGNPNFPQCGFSAQLVEILNRMGIPYKSMNVLSNNSIREGIKQFSNWPTIPQVYYKQKFIGGCDIVTEMYESGELDKVLGVA